MGCDDMAECEDNAGEDGMQVLGCKRYCAGTNTFHPSTCHHSVHVALALTGIEPQTQGIQRGEWRGSCWNREEKRGRKLEAGKKSL